MLVLVGVMGVSTSFGGIFVNDKSVNNQSCGSIKVETVLDLTGIIVAGFTGIIVAGKVDVPQPCTTNDGGTMSLDGIIVAG